MNQPDDLTMRKLMADATRFLRVVPEDGDILTTVLKGHLLIEEQLRAIVRAASVDYAHIEEERISFNLLLKLAHALAGDHLCEPHIWQCADALNRIRNTLGHQAEPKDIDGKLASFFEICEGFERWYVQIGGSRTVDALRDYIGFVYGNFGELAILMRQMYVRS